MCVAVSLMPGSTLTEEEIYRMGTTNGDGLGIAWIKDGQVHWYKTLQYKVGHIAHALQVHIDVPRLVHFRLSTVGGTRPDLCHPFAIDHRASCEATGHADLVMIHNGHWTRYKELLELCDKEGMLPDKGPWSDTRLIALMAADDLDWLKIITGKVATLDKDGQFTHIGDWDELREGVKVSNKHWNHEIPVKKGGYSGFNKWQGWDKEWGEKTWETWEKEKAEKEEARKAEIAAAREAVRAEREAMRATTNNKGSGNGTKEQGQAAGGESQGQGAGVSGVSGGPVGSASWLEGGKGGGPTSRGGGLRKPLPGDGSPYFAGNGTERRTYDGSPVRSPSTGRVYEVTPEGRVVEVADKGANQDLRGPQGDRNPLPGTAEDSSAAHWLDSEIRGAGIRVGGHGTSGAGGSSGGLVETTPVHGEDGDLGDEDVGGEGGES